MLFWKWISDTWDYEHEQAIEEYGDQLNDEIEADFHQFDLPTPTRWTKVTNSAANLGANITKAFARIEQANPRGAQRNIRRRGLVERRPAAAIHAHRFDQGVQPEPPLRNWESLTVNESGHGAGLMTLRTVGRCSHFVVLLRTSRGQSTVDSRGRGDRKPTRSRNLIDDCDPEAIATPACPEVDAHEGLPHLGVAHGCLLLGLHDPAYSGPWSTERSSWPRSHSRSGLMGVRSASG